VVLEAEAVDAFRLYVRARGTGGAGVGAGKRRPRARPSTLCSEDAAGRAEDGAAGDAGPKRRRARKGAVAGEGPGRSGSAGVAAVAGAGRGTGRWVQAAAAAAAAALPAGLQQARAATRAPPVAAPTVPPRAGGGDPAHRCGEDGAVLSVQSLVAMVAEVAQVQPSTVDCRPAGPLGAVYPLTDYERVAQALFSAFASARNTTVVPIPASTLAALRSCRRRQGCDDANALGAATGGGGGSGGEDAANDDWERVAQRIPSVLRTSLLPYQVAGVCVCVCLCVCMWAEVCGNRRM